MSMTRKWSLLTAVLIVGILAASWFLLVSPTRGKASDLRDQATQQQATNEGLVQKLNQLKAQSLDLPKQKAALAVFRRQIPDNPALPTLIRDLTAAGRKVGVVVQSMKPGTPVPVVAVAPVPVAPPASTTSDTSGTATDGTTDGTSTAPAAVAPTAPSLYALPLNLEITGSYFEVEQFLNKLEGMRRSFLVNGFDLKPGGGETSGGTSGTTAADGDLTLTLDGRVFLSPTLATTATSTSAAAPVTAQAQ